MLRDDATSFLYHFRLIPDFVYSIKFRFLYRRSTLSQSRYFNLPFLNCLEVYHESD